MPGPRARVGTDSSLHLISYTAWEVPASLSFLGQLFDPLSHPNPSAHEARASIQITGARDTRPVDRLFSAGISGE